MILGNSKTTKKEINIKDIYCSAIYFINTHYFKFQKTLQKPKQKRHQIHYKSTKDHLSNYKYRNLHTCVE